MCAAYFQGAAVGDGRGDQGKLGGVGIWLVHWRMHGI